MLYSNYWINVALILMMGNCVHFVHLGIPPHPMPGTQLRLNYLLNCNSNFFEVCI